MSPIEDDDARGSAEDHLSNLVLRENVAIQRALADLKKRGVSDDVAVVVIDEDGNTTVFAMARGEIRKMVATLPQNMNLHERLAVPAKPGHLWAVVYSVDAAHVTGMAMELVRMRAPKA